MRRRPDRYMYRSADRACSVRGGSHMCDPRPRRMRRGHIDIRSVNGKCSGARDLGPRTAPPDAHPDRRAGRRRDRRRRDARRVGHHRLVQTHLGHDHERPDRLRDRGARADLVADDRDRVRLVLDPPLWLSRLRSPLDPGAGLLRGGRRAELRPAGQPRHAGDAADVHHDHRRRHVRRGARRDGGREDLLHPDRSLLLRTTSPSASTS